MHSGAQAFDPPGAPREHVADLVDRHGAADRFGCGLEPVPHLSVVIAERQALDAALGGRAEACGLHQRVPEALGVDLEVLHPILAAPPAVRAYVEALHRAAAR